MAGGRNRRPRTTRGPVQPEERERVRELHRQGKGRNEIAEALGRGAGTITRIAGELGLSFDREPTRVATEAHKVDMAAERAQLAQDLLDDIRRLRERAWSKYTVVGFTKDGADAFELNLPPLGEVRNAYAAIGICFDKHKIATEMDADPTNLPAVDKWLRAMMGGGE